MAKCGECGAEVHPHTGGCPWKCNVDRAGAVGPQIRTNQDVNQDGKPSANQDAPAKRRGK